VVDESDEVVAYRASDLVKQEEMEEKLKSGWEWMKRNPEHSKLQSFWERWELLNQEYMDLFDVVRKEGLSLPPPSPWIEELRTQLTLGGIADVEPKPKERLQS
jgi:hypothetical protein